MGHVSGLEKYKYVIWNDCERLSSIDDGDVRWLWIKGPTGGLRLGSSLIYQLMRQSLVFQWGEGVVLGGFID